MKFLRRRSRRILYVSLPFLVGGLLALLTGLLFPSIYPILSSIDFGVAAFVFGMTIRNPAVVAFVFGFLATAVIAAAVYWDRRRIAQAQTLYADYVQETNKDAVTSCVVSIMRSRTRLRTCARRWSICRRRNNQRNMIGQWGMPTALWNA